MKTLSKLVSASSVSLLVITSPVLISSSHTSPIGPNINVAAVAAPRFHSLNLHKVPVFTAPVTSVAAAPKVEAVSDKADMPSGLNVQKSIEAKMVVKEAGILYEYMRLNKSGLNQKAFEYAWRGYHNLLKNGKLSKTNYLSICDYSQSSRRKRFYVIDVQNKKLLYNTYVAHGMNSGLEYATSFSNRPESFKSSLGFFVTAKTYVGRNGLSLRFKGMDKGFNDNAFKRNIALHGSDYIGADYLKNNGEMGRSLGCAAIPNGVSHKIIKTIKDGTCFFIYHPSKKYLSQSNVING